MQHRRRAISTRSPAVLDEEMINQGNGWGYAFSFLRCFDTAGLVTKKISNVKLEEEVKQHGECLCIHTLTHAQTYTQARNTMPSAPSIIRTEAEKPVTIIAKNECSKKMNGETANPKSPQKRPLGF